MFFFKDLNVSGRRIFFNDFGYYIVFGIKVLGVLIFGKNKVRFEKNNLLLFNVGLFFLSFILFLLEVGVFGILVLNVMWYLELLREVFFLLVFRFLKRNK